jgi:hypothetical protein
MIELKIHPRYKVGDRVRLVFGTGLVGTVMEARGSYYETGHALYRIHVPMNPEPLVLAVREEEIEKV